MALGPVGTDPCSNPRSHIQAATRYSLETKTNGLREPWFGLTFANFPFSKPLEWCVRLRWHGHHVDTDHAWVALHKLDPTVAWWRELMAGCDDWAPFNFRFKFERNDRESVTPNFACALSWRRWSPPPDIASVLWMRGARSIVVPDTVT